LVQWPKHRNSGAYFDAESSVHGICRDMGYQYGVQGSILYSSAYGKLDVLNVDDQGRINRSERDYPVFSVLCINATGALPPQISGQVEMPKHPESGAYFDAESSVDGICRVLGYSYGVPGSITYTSAYGKQDVLNVGASGRIDHAEQDYPVASVYCVR
jgi:hypothetical protein